MPFKMYDITLSTGFNINLGNFNKIMQIKNYFLWLAWNKSDKKLNNDSLHVPSPTKISAIYRVTQKHFPKKHHMSPEESTKNTTRNNRTKNNHKIKLYTIQQSKCTVSANVLWCILGAHSVPNLFKKNNELTPNSSKSISLSNSNSCSSKHLLGIKKIQWNIIRIIAIITLRLQ